MAKCEACDATIMWLANDATGRKAPINTEPDPEGNVVIPEPGRYRLLRKVERAQAESLFAEPVPRYKSHFATCPHPEHFRRCQVCHHEPCECPSKPYLRSGDIDGYNAGRR